MIYAGQEIEKMLDIELIQHLKRFELAEQKRLQASQHNKFTRTDGKAIKLPDVNPEYLKIKNDLMNELNKRNLTLE